MRKKILILSIVLSFIAVLAIIISNSLYLRHLYSLIKTEPNYLTNIPQLYSSFTDYMRDKVDSHLQLLGCEPKEYYYDNHTFCFICYNIHPCFGYAWVRRETGVRKKNPSGVPYIVGAEEFDTKFADFCWDGLASEFNCQKINEDSLGCGKVEFVATSKGRTFKCDDIKLVLKEGVATKDFAEDFCKLKKEELERATEYPFFCGRYQIRFIESREIVILQK